MNKTTFFSPENIDTELYYEFKTDLIERLIDPYIKSLKQIDNFITSLEFDFSSYHQSLDFYEKHKEVLLHFSNADAFIEFYTSDKSKDLIINTNWIYDDEEYGDCFYETDSDQIKLYLEFFSGKLSSEEYYQKLCSNGLIPSSINYIGEELSEIYMDDLVEDNK